MAGPGRRASAAKTTAVPRGESTLVAIIGSDSYLAEQALERALQSGLGPDGERVVDLLQGDEVSWARVVDAARSLSLFAPRRAVVVRRAEGLKGGEEEILAYLKDPNPLTILVLMAAKVDRRRSVWKRVAEVAAVVPAEPLKGAGLRSHVMTELRRRRLDLDPDAVSGLLELVGQDLRRLMGELDKLESYASASGGRLDLETVEDVLGRGFARPVFRLGDAVGARRMSEALALCEELLEEGQEALYLLAVFVRSVRQTRLVRALQAERASADEIGTRLGLPPQLRFKVPDILQGARRWDDSALAGALRALVLADRRLKSGVEGRVALTALCAALAAGSSPRQTPSHGVRAS